MVVLNDSVLPPFLVSVVGCVAGTPCFMFSSLWQKHEQLQAPERVRFDGWGVVAKRDVEKGSSCARSRWLESYKSSQRFPDATG